MSTTGVAALDHTVQETNVWLRAVAEQLHFEDRQHAYNALRAVLHALRDRLSPEVAVHFGAQLPMLVRGLYYEGWHPGAHRSAQSVNAFCARVHDAVDHDPGIDSEVVARAVFALIAARLSPSEIEDVIAATPKSLHAIWPS